MSRRYARCPLATVALATLAGCGSISWNRTKVEKAVREVLTKQANVQVRSVTCPSNAKIAKGVVTPCNATLSNGERVRFNATQTDAKGDVHVGPAEMIALEVQNSIQEGLRRRGVTASARCRQHVPIVVGTTFVCAATDARGRHLRIGVTVTDRSAGFRLRLLGP
jgi:hypothetical protein